MESWAATPVFSLPELAQLGGPLSPYLQGRVRADIRRCVMDEASYVGIDVSKARLDVAIHPGAKSLAGGKQRLRDRRVGLAAGGPDSRRGRAGGDRRL